MATWDELTPEEKQRYIDEVYARDVMMPPSADAAFTPTVPTAGSSYQFGDVGRDAGNEALQAVYPLLASAVNPQSSNLLDVATNYATGTAGGLLSGAIGLGQKAGGYAADVLGAGAEALPSWLGGDRWSRGGSAQALYGDMQAGGQSAGLGTEANALGLLSELGAGKYARGAITDRLSQPGPVPTMYSNPIAGLLGDAGKKDAGFDIVRKDASGIFGAGTERVRYTDPKSGGTMEVVVRPDGSASVLELEVPEASRGKGIGQSLQERVMQDFPVMGGQVSSKAAATTAYRLGRRPVGKPNATLKDVFAEMEDMSSVNMISPQMQALRTPADPVAVRGAEVMDMLKSGRGSDVTDQMLDMGDSVLNARLNEYLYKNADIPMDEASRMARSDKMFNQDGYHATNEDFQALSPPVKAGVDEFATQQATFLTRSPSAANDFARKNIIPMKANAISLFDPATLQSNPDARWLDDSWSKLGRDLVDDAASGKLGDAVDDPEGYAAAAASGQWDIIESAPFQNWLRDKGFEDFNVSEAGNQNFAIQDPSRIRSRFARFDPRLSHLKNLSASVGAGLLGAGMMPDRGNQQ